MLALSVQANTTLTSLEPVNVTAVGPSTMTCPTASINGRALGVNVTVPVAFTPNTFNNVPVTVIVVKSPGNGIQTSRYNFLIRSEAPNRCSARNVSPKDNRARPENQLFVVVFNPSRMKFTAKTMMESIPNM